MGAVCTGTTCTAVQFWCVVQLKNYAFIPLDSDESLGSESLESPLRVLSSRVTPFRLEQSLERGVHDR